MPVSSSALNLAQYAVMSNEPMVKAVTFSLIDNGSVMARDIPFITKKSLYVNGVRWEGNLPTVNWVPLNQDPPNTIGTPTSFQEQVYLIRNVIDVDAAIVEDENQIQDPRATQLDAYLKSVAYNFNNNFINGDGATDVNAIVGLRKRIDNPTIYGVRSAAKIDAGGVVLTTAGLTAATANSFFQFLDQLLWACDAPYGSPNLVLYVNDDLWRRLHFAVRSMGTTGGFAITQDQFDRTIMTYKSCPLIDVGYLSDQSTRIITSTETNAGVNGASTFTSIYAVNYSPGHFYGWQYDVLQARDLGLLNNGVTYRTVIDWRGGLINDSNRSVGRIFDIKMT